MTQIKLKERLFTEPKSVTSFNYFTFFHTDIKQSEVEDSFKLTSDWIKSARKNVNKSKAVTLAFWDPCCKRSLTY